MAKNYLKKRFFLDLIATLPFDIMVQKQDSDIESNWTAIFELFKLGRLLRITKIVQFLRAFKSIKGSILVLKIIIFLLIYLHCYACIWWLIVSRD